MSMIQMDPATSEQAAALPHSAAIGHAVATWIPGHSPVTVWVDARDQAHNLTPDEATDLFRVLADVLGYSVVGW